MAVWIGRPFPNRWPCTDERFHQAHFFPTLLFNQSRVNTEVKISQIHIKKRMLFATCKTHSSETDVFLSDADWRPWRIHVIDAALFCISTASEASNKTDWRMKRKSFESRGGRRNDTRKRKSASLILILISTKWSLCWIQTNDDEKNGEKIQNIYVFRDRYI